MSKRLQYRVINITVKSDTNDKVTSYVTSVKWQNDIYMRVFDREQ